MTMTTTDLPSGLTSVGKNTEEITCNFCGQKKAVFRVENPTEYEYKCSQCNAIYFQYKKPGITKPNQIIIQDISLLHSDKIFWGFIKVFGAEGDITKARAKSLNENRGLKPMPGFDSLTEDFTSLLWCNTAGKPLLDGELIEDVCRQYARRFTYKNTDESVTLLDFPRKIFAAMNKEELKKIHELINSIPKSNGNLIRYFIAEAQEELVLKGIRKVLKGYKNRKNELGVQIVTSMCI